MKTCSENYGTCVYPSYGFDCDRGCDCGFDCGRDYSSDGDSDRGYGFDGDSGRDYGCGFSYCTFALCLYCNC